MQNLKIFGSAVNLLQHLFNCSIPFSNFNIDLLQYQVNSGSKHGTAFFGIFFILSKITFNLLRNEE